MTVFECADFDGHETVAFFHDKKTDLKSIIAVAVAEESLAGKDHPAQAE